jgi:hypothetical protein
LQRPVAINALGVASGGGVGRGGNRGFEPDEGQNVEPGKSDNTIVVTAQKTYNSLRKSYSVTRRSATLTLRALQLTAYFVHDLLFTPACGCPPNIVENKRANDAKRQAERQTGKKFTRAQERRFHDNITGMGLDYHELVAEGVYILIGQW